jgi:hypothetical protein
VNRFEIVIAGYGIHAYRIDEYGYRLQIAWSAPTLDDAIRRCVENNGGNPLILRLDQIQG